VALRLASLKAQAKQAMSASDQNLSLTELAHKLGFYSPTYHCVQKINANAVSVVSAPAAFERARK